MSFDLSRIRFDSRNDFLGVIMQQGRVQLDADWNEWVAELARRLMAGTLDTYNGNVVPRTTPDGFLIEAKSGKLSIGPGRIYVDGLLAENHGGAPDAWDPKLAELNGTKALDYNEQPYYKDPPALPTANGPHLVYLDVWQRDITALQDPGLVEQAVGVDTTGRRQTVWQVKVLSDVGAVTCASPDTDIKGWSDIIMPSGARLSTDTAPPKLDSDPCRVPPAAGYLGLENQLYRVEVHTGGKAGQATFKWSRDNATVASRVTHIPTLNTITVESIGRDDVLGFHDGDWVEITDDWREFKNLPGELRRISVGGGVDKATRTLHFDAPLPGGMFPVTGSDNATVAERNTRVRRWDQSGQVYRKDGTAVPGQNLNAAGSTGEIKIPAAGTWLFLENGIIVNFDLDSSGGEFKTGDYWVFAARSVDASIEKLDQAPPLGIHHHYARLALVTFPDTQTDCRTLWPPQAAETGCDCTVCVSAEEHNNGTATLQQAIDRIKDTGGTICLGTGTYHIDGSLNINEARSLRIRGQGWATLLVGRQSGSIFKIGSTNGIALENLTVIGSSSDPRGTPAIAAHNCLDMRLEHINVLATIGGHPLTYVPTSVALGLEGFMLGTSIHDCALVAEYGVVNLGESQKNYLLTGELRMERNLFFCSKQTVRFWNSSLHFGTSRIDGNLMIAGAEAAITATGGVLPGSTMSLSDNVIYTGGDGIRAGVDGLSIERNEIHGAGANSGDGITLERGLDPVALDHALIRGNRLLGLHGNGISINQRVENGTISENIIDGMGLGALVMGGDGSAGTLRISGNQFLNVGQDLANTSDAFAAVQLVRVDRGDVVDNVVADVARTAFSAPAIDGLRAVSGERVRVSGNRFYGIGPDRSGGDIAAVHLPPPFDRVAIDNNHMDRVADASQQVTPARWYAIDITFEPVDQFNHFSPSVFFMVSKEAYLITKSGVFSAVVRPRPSVSIRGNMLHGQHTTVPLNRCAAVDDCLFADNHCEVVGQDGKEPLLGDLRAVTLNASNNRLIGVGDADTVHLYPVGKPKHAIVLGNTSSGNIRVKNGGTAVPDYVNHPTNIILGY